MKVTVFGTGYVGLVTGVCLADLGNEVICVDINAEKIAYLKSGHSPIHEQGMDELLNKLIPSGQISFTTDMAKGVEHGEYLFIAVGTPADADGAADLQYVYAVAKSIGEHLNHYAVVIDKSTVPVGTGDEVKNIIQKELKKRSNNIEFDVISNPEFLKQGDAIRDFVRSDRIIIGFDDQRALEKMQKLYQPLQSKVITMDVRSAELTKYAANAFLATKISFINDISLLAEKLEVDVENVRIGIGSDLRIGKDFLHAGCGYGGSCFPKDVKALVWMARDCGFDVPLFEAVENINNRQKHLLFNRLEQHFKNKLENKTIALWGLAFKPNTDDMRDAPSRTLLEALWKARAKVRAYDPAAMKEAERIYGKRSDFILCDDPYETLVGADLLVVITEWEEFRQPDFALIKQTLKQPVVFDGRNLYDPKTMDQLGIDYYCIGRKRA